MMAFKAMVVKDLESLEDPALEPFREIRRAALWLRKGIFFAEGERTIIRLLKSRVFPESMLLSPQYFESWGSILESRMPKEGTVWLAEKSRMEKLCGLRLTQPAVAWGLIPDFGDPLVFFRNRGTSLLLVALDGVDHAVNVGAIVRNCVAFGVEALLLDRRAAHPYNHRAIRASAGSVFHLPFFIVPDLAAVLKQSGARILAADPKGDTSLSCISLSGDVCIVFGNEHQGISQEIRNMAVTVRVDTEGGVDSLNVSCAAAVFLFVAHQARSSL